MTRSTHPCRETATRGRLLVRALWLLVVLLVAGAGFTAGKPPAIAAKCKADLVKRLNVPEKNVTVLNAEPIVWPNAALGMPENDMLYAQVETPGWRIWLKANNEQYLYTASAKAFKYAGPGSLHLHSLLYVMPKLDEPNLNGDLYQCSVVGTNSIRIASGVADYYPQANGNIIFTRRTSRSGFDLLLVNAGKPDKATLLYGAFAFGGAALNEKGDAWAAFVRAGVGNAWTVVVARTGDENAKKVTLELHETAQPNGIAWVGDKVMIRLKYNKVGLKAPACLEVSPFAEKPELNPAADYNFPGANAFVLNKSESLEITQQNAGGKPNVEVARVWFTGDRNIKATLPGLTLRGYEWLADAYVLVWGEADGKTVAYSVNIASGEVITAKLDGCQDVKPFACYLTSFPATSAWK